VELFRGDAARLLLAGNAMHADIPSVAPGSGAFGWILSMLAQDVGYPVPEGGAGRLAGAMASRAEAAGVDIRTGARVTSIRVRDGRAVGALTAGGDRFLARHAVLADVAAPTLYRDLLPPGAVPPRLLAELERCFEWDLPTVKVNWALDGPVPWRAPELTGAGTVHCGADVAQLAAWSTALATGQPSDVTFQLVGQMATADPARAPAGGESLWAYSHLPRGTTDPTAARHLAERMHDTIEAHAPGFSGRVVDRWEQMPRDLEEADANLVDGAVNGGTAQIYQQLVFRPTTGLGRPETVVRALYLAGAATSPGGGVHGACGAIAARAALQDARLGGIPGRVMVSLTRRLHR
jgi:phytoene dehydrogenase-like protein